ARYGSGLSGSFRWTVRRPAATQAWCGRRAEVSTARGVTICVSCCHRVMAFCCLRPADGVFPRSGGRGNRLRSRPTTPQRARGSHVRGGSVPGRGRRRGHATSLLGIGHITRPPVRRVSRVVRGGAVGLRVDWRSESACREAENESNQRHLLSESLLANWPFDLCGTGRATARMSPRATL